MLEEKMGSNALHFLKLEIIALNQDHKQKAVAVV